jgi:hypothetical protein
MKFRSGLAVLRSLGLAVFARVTTGTTGRTGKINLPLKVLETKQRIVDPGADRNTGHINY